MPNITAGRTVKTLKTSLPSKTAATKKPATTKSTVSVKMGVVTANIKGKKIEIKDSNIGPFNKAFILDGGKTIAYSGMDGAGGFENEGQSLRLYDVATGKTSKVMAGYFMIDKVTTAKSADGKTALLVDASDGGLGGDHFSIVDPVRGGEVFQAGSLAKLVSHKGDLVKIALFDENSYMNDTGKPRPTGYQSVNLSKALQAPLIHNKTFDEIMAEQPQ